MFLVRLAPVIPFNLLNYALAITKVKFVHYVIATAIGMIPGTVMYVYFGSVAGSLSDIAAGNAGPGLEYQFIFWGVSGVLIIVVSSVL